MDELELDLTIRRMGRSDGINIAVDIRARRSACIPSRANDSARSRKESIGFAPTRKHAVRVSVRVSAWRCRSSRAPRPAPARIELGPVRSP